MRKYLLFLIGLISIYYPCTITIAPKSASGWVGDSIKFKITVKNIHLPCLLTINATQFNYDKVSLIKASDWDTINVTTFEKTILVRLERSGVGEISISRTCPIRTSEAKVTIDIKQKEVKNTFTSVTKEIKQLLVAISQNDSLIQRLKSLRAWLTDSSELKDEKLLRELNKILILADSLKKKAMEVSKSAILK